MATSGTRFHRASKTQRCQARERRSPDSLARIGAQVEEESDCGRRPVQYRSMKGRESLFVILVVNVGVNLTHPGPFTFHCTALSSLSPAPFRITPALRLSFNR